MQSSTFKLRFGNARRRCHPIPIASFEPDTGCIDWRGAHGDFYQLAAPIKAKDDVRFVIQQTETHLFILIRVAPKASDPAFESRTVEVSFCPGDDRFTRWQYLLEAGGALKKYPYSPTGEVHSSRYRIPSPTHAKVETKNGDVTLYTLGFILSDILPHPVPTGIQVGSSTTSGYSSWSYCSGNGGQDASSFGLLFPGPPDFEASVEIAQSVGTAVFFSGISNSELEMEIVDPKGRESAHRIERSSDKWNLQVAIRHFSSTGRYRIRLKETKNPTQAIEFPLDVAAHSESPDKFSLAITNDPPMSLMLGAYTPERLDLEMRLLKQNGLNRLHWIDFETLIRHWNDPRWIAHVDATLQACHGNLLKTAAEAARRNGIQLVADLKIFDLGANTFWNPGDSQSSVTELDGLPYCLAPEIASNPDLGWQLPPGVKTQARLPIRQLTIFSETPLESLTPDDISLRVSDDNKEYRRYSGPFTLRQGQLDRKHKKWTVEGLIEEPGTQANWFLELSGLAIETSYLSFSAAGRPASHRAFMLVEAIDSAGNLAPVTLATSKKDGTPLFWKEWLGWSNRIDPLFLERDWQLSDLTMTFQLAPRIPALLEPSAPRSHEVWLAWVDRLLDSGVDGVSIRTLCHHTSIESYLKYSWGPAVQSAFQAKHRRQPRLSGKDDQAMQAIRTEAYLEFLEKASAKVRNAGKLFNLQLESGFELKPEHQGRMQFGIPYGEIFRRRLVDEVSFKWFTSENAWLHECVLPKARVQKIAAQIISRNLSPVSAFDLPRTLPLLVENARLAGFQGYNLYEFRDLLEKDIVDPKFHHDVAAALEACG